MVELTADTVTAFLQSYGLLALFFGMVLEEVLFFIPAGLIIVAAGAVLIQASALIPALSEILFEVAIVGSAGVTFGSFFMYSIGFYGGERAIDRFGSRFGVSYGDVERFEKHFGEEREKEYLALFRVLPVFPITTVSAAAGFFRMEWRSYAAITFIGMIPRHIVYGYLGWRAGESYSQVLAQISRYSRIITVVFLGIVVLYLLWKYDKFNKPRRLIRL
ncbi:MAG: DedA family protein [Candidatus Nanohaloarchaea archaeon]